MGNSLVRKAIGWIVVVAVLIIAFKVVVAIIAGLVQTLFAVALLVFVVFAVLWAMRRL